MSKAPTQSYQKSFSDDQESSRSRYRRIAQRTLALGVRLLQWLARKFQLARVSRKSLAWSTALLFVLATGLAIRQYTQPFVWHEPYPLFRPRWWYHPLEWNVVSALPQISGNINAVSATPDGTCLWIAGDAGLLAFSRDQGKTWTQLFYDPTTGDFRAPTDAKPCGTAKPSTSWLSLLPVVYAASEEGSPPEQAQQSNPVENSTAQTQRSVPQSKGVNIQGPSQNPNGNTSANAQNLLPEKSLQVFPPVVEFGSAIVNSPGYAPGLGSLHIRNVGQAPISLSRVTLSPSVFQFDPKQRDSCSDQTLLPGKECIVPLIFLPTKAEETKGQLSFASDNR